ncbi:MAG: hypothetical protein C0404_10600 [Verrucomicrobia bacterium]|nr:hypothetical protein [Verrucomicrobiota bacterium]
MNAAASLSAGQVYEGFRLDRVVPLPGLRATALQFEHVRSGARLLHLQTEDTENCFAITFPTPPADDTGLPHILEHSVLGGSRKYPVREPFFEMIKMSMATFINAMTASTYTVYPIASNVKKDFFNLAEVYVDAVFHPELKEETFRREGHHLTLADNNNLNSALSIKGIVYSEMKGAYSSPESLVYRHTLAGILPDTPMGCDSGGDPDSIPKLTYRQFKKFHKDYYHPGNSLIFIYGDIPTLEHLRFLSPALTKYNRQTPKIAVPAQPRWSAPRRLEEAFPIGRTEDSKARAFLALNWLAGDATDPAESIDLAVLDKILLGNEAAPLKKAIIDSKLGADVFWAGAWDAGYAELFAAGIKGTEPDRADAFEKLVLDTLGRIAAGEISPARVESAFQQLTYKHREVETLFPLHVLFKANSTWPYGGDPLEFLRMDEHLEACRKRYAADAVMFNRLIRERLLDNNHRLLLVLRPDCEEQARIDNALAKRMAKQKTKLSPEKIAAIAKEAAALEAAQNKPNPPEALARLPQLKVGDLPAKPRHIQTELAEVAGIEVLRNDVFSNGVNYLELSADVSGLPDELYEYLPRYTDAMNKLGAAGQNFVQIAERRAACTGGLSCSASIRRHVSDQSRSLRTIRFSLKTLDGQAEKAFRLLGDIVFGIDPNDRDRLRDAQVQSRARYQTQLVSGAAGTAMRQAARGFTPEAALDHLFMSPRTLRFVEQFTSNFDGNAEKLIASIGRIRDFLLQRGRWTASFTGSECEFGVLQKTLTEWSSRMRGGQVERAPSPFTAFAKPTREGLTGPMKVAHCAKVMPAPDLAHPDAPLFHLGIFMTALGYCLPEIRFKGNAYGAGAAFDDGTGTVKLYSAQDPRIVETLEVFDRVHDYFSAAKWTQTDIDRAIIGSMKDVEKPIRPGEATGTALTRHLRGDTNELREKRYAAVLRATPDQVKRVLLEQFEAGEAKASVCVVSSREKLEEANRALGGRVMEISDILT